MTSEAEARQVVVAGVDGSAASVAALGWAVRHGKATGATVRAVHAWHYPAAAGVVPPVGVTPAPVEEQVEQRLRDVPVQWRRVLPGRRRPQRLTGYARGQLRIVELDVDDVLDRSAAAHGT